MDICCCGSNGEKIEEKNVEWARLGLTNGFEWKFHFRYGHCVCMVLCICLSVCVCCFFPFVHYFAGSCSCILLYSMTTPILHFIWFLSLVGVVCHCFFIYLASFLCTYRVRSRDIASDLRA